MSAATAPTRTFTVEQANATLPLLSRIVEDVQRTYAQILELRRGLECPPQLAGKPHPLEQRYDEAMGRLGGLIDELHAIGVELKDFQKGIVDFPAERYGFPICLCWQQGEERVEHWHGVNEGRSMRRRVEA